MYNVSESGVVFKVAEYGEIWCVYSGKVECSVRRKNWQIMVSNQSF